MKKKPKKIMIIYFTLQKNISGIPHKLILTTALRYHLHKAEIRLAIKGDEKLRDKVILETPLT